MRTLQTALVATALSAKQALAEDTKAFDFVVPDYENMVLTFDEQKALYEKVTGPYCQDEVAYTNDPICMHVLEEVQARANKTEWKEPEFEAPAEYCSRFPGDCESANRLRINTETRQLVDMHGRTTLLHGVNAIYKVAPYIPITDSFDPQNSLNDKDIHDL